MSNNFWQYEPKSIYNRRMARRWATDARKYAFGRQAQGVSRTYNISPSPELETTRFDKPLLRPRDLDEIQPKQKGQGPVRALGDVLGSTGLFAGDVDQPWDVLRPVARALEAEQKYIVRPMAKAVLSPLPGEYEDLPSFVRNVTEFAVDPLNFIPLGALMKAGRLGARASVGLRGFNATAKGAGSKRALGTFMARNLGYGAAAGVGQSVAEELDLPGPVGSFIGAAVGGRLVDRIIRDPGPFDFKSGTRIRIVNPSDERVYHGTVREFDLPSIQPKQRKYISLSADKGLYVALDPKHMEVDIGSGANRNYGPEGMRYETPKPESHEEFRATGGRVYPLILKKGTKLFDPIADEWPVGYEPLKQRVIEATEFSALDQILSTGLTHGDFREQGLELLRRLEQMGYQGWATPWELLIWDNKALTTAYTNEEILKSFINPSDPEMQRLLKIEEEALAKLDLTPEQIEMANRAGVQSMEDTEFVLNFIRRQKAGEVISQADLRRAERLLKNQTSRPGGGTLGAAKAIPDKLDEMLTKIDDLEREGIPNPFGALHPWEVISHANEGRRLIQFIRDTVTRALPVSTLRKLQSLGVRVQEDPMITPLFNRAGGIRYAGESWAASQTDMLIRAMRKAGVDSSTLAKAISDPIYAQTLLPNQTAVLNIYNDIIENQTRIEQRVGMKTHPEVNLSRPIEDALATRINDGYREIANRYLDNALSDLVKTPTQLLPPRLISDMDAIRPQRLQLQRLHKLVSDAMRIKRKEGFKRPNWTPASIEIDNLITSAEMARDSFPSANERVLAWSKVRKSITSEINKIDQQWKPLQQERKRLMGQIRRGSGPASNYDMYREKFYPRTSGGQETLDPRGLNLAASVKAFREGSEPGGAVGAINWFNQNTRPLMATLDLSPLGVQGLLTLLNNPVLWARTAIAALTNGYDVAVDRFYRRGVLDDFIKHDGHYSARFDLGDYVLPSFLERAPGIGKVASWSTNFFTNFGNILRLELYESGLRPGMTTAQKQQLARTVNLVSGFNPTDPTSLEKTIEFAPRFFRSQFGFLADALTKHDLSNRGAARYLATFIGAGAAMTYAINEASGQATDFDPESYNFMRVRFGGKDISLFGTWDTLVRAAFKSFNDPVEGAQYLSRVKASPAVSRLFDVIEGETLSGMQLDASSPTSYVESTLELAASSVLPISAQNVLHEGRFSNPETIGATGIEFLGVKATPLSPGEQMALRRDDAASRTYGVSWSELEPSQRAELLRNDSRLDLESTTDVGRAFDLRTAIGSRYEARQKEIDQLYPEGQDWVRAYQDLRREQAGAFGQWAEEHPEAAVRMRNSKSKNPLEQKRLEYFRIFDQADRENWSPAEIAESISEFESNLSADERAYIERNTGVSDTPRVRAYKAAQDIMRPYWKIEDQVWDKMKSRSQEASKFDTLQDYVNSSISEMRSQGMSDEQILRRISRLPLLRNVERATQEIRRRFRRSNPDVDAALVRWYGYSPVRRI